MKTVTEPQFLRSLEELFELPASSLNSSMRLEEIPNWGSLTFLGLLAFVDEELEATITPKQFQQCNTIADVINLLGDRIQPD